MRRISFLLVFVLFISGCATLQTVKNSRGLGVKRIYNYSYEDVYKAVLIGVSQPGIEIVEQNKEKGYLYASRGMTAFSWGERIAIFLSKIDKKKTEVEIVCKRVVSTNIFARDWTDNIFNAIEKELQRAEYK